MANQLHTSGRRLCQRTCVAVLLLVLPGCVGMRGFGWRSHGDPLAGAPKPKWAEDPQVEEVVDHLNRNVDKLQAWRANSVKIRANNIPLSGTLAVERDRHLRLVVNSIAGNEVDMGSNDELFWIWAKRMQPAYVFCHHEHTEAARQTLGIPFEPDWLMQALGVSPLKVEGTRLELEPEMRQARLIQNVVSAHGQPLRKVILVDLPRGVILEHSVYDYHGQRIAQARLEEHQLDKPSGIVLPRRVKLDWPQNEMSLVMHLGQVEVNPKSLPSQMWDRPRMPGVQMVDLGAEARGNRRFAEREPIQAVRLLEPEVIDGDGAGRVKLMGAEPADNSEAPVEHTTIPIQRPTTEEWWDER